jgi:nicotinamidase-related amidase/predicted MFS family arabinose efflux permease
VTHRKGDESAPAPFGFKLVAPLALGAALNPINSTMISTALVPIAESLHATVAEVGWLVAGLYLTCAVAQPTMGHLVDLFGPRRIFLISLVFVAAAGLFGLVASSLSSLVAARVLLGVGTSAAYPAAMRIFRTEADRTHSKPPRFAMGLLSLAAMSTTAVGPLFGGILTGAFGWHAIFTVNLPLALLTALLILLWIPKDRRRAVDAMVLFEAVDLVGVGLFMGFLLSLMIFLVYLENRWLWPALLGALICGAVLAIYSLRRKRPFIDVRMLAHNRPLSVTYLRAATNSLIVFSVYYGFAQWLQSAAGFSSAAAGLVTLPMSVVAAGSTLMGVRTRGLRGPFAASIGAALAGCIGLGVIDSGTSIWIVAAVFMFFGVAMGTFSTATQAAVYVQAPAAEVGAAAGLQRTSQYIGAVAAAGSLGLIYGQRATDHGLHNLALVMGALSAVLFIATLFDRTIPRTVSTTVAETGDAITIDAPMKGNNVALTKLDAVPALVAIDLQKGLLALPAAHPIPEIVGRVADLARAFRKHGLPVVFVNVAGAAPGRTERKFNFQPPPDWTDFVPELDRQPSDYTVTKLQVGAFYGTALEQILRRRGVTQVVLAGVATSSGVEATARNAYDHGYNVTLVVDAMTDLDAEAHRHSVEKIFPKLGETATTEEVLKLLAQRPVMAA